MNKRVALFFCVLTLLSVLWGCRMPSPPPPPPPPPLVDVQVCSESLKLPTNACPETAILKFPENAIPKDPCPLHEAFPIAEDYDGQLIGMSCYELVKHPLEDIEWFLRELVKAGGNATEAFAASTWNDTWRWQPYELGRNEKGEEYWETEKWKDKPWNPDPNHKFPVFDLSKWNEDVWAKWRGILELCRKMNVTIIVRVQDYCSRKDNFLERHWSFWSCVQSWRWGGSMHGGYLHWPPGDGGAGNAEYIWPYYDRLNERMVRTLVESGAKFYLEPWNELYVEKGSDWPADSPDEFEANTLIHKWFVDSFKRYGCPADRIICNPGQVPDREDPRHRQAVEDMRLLDVITEHHGCASPEVMRRIVELFGAGRLTFPNGDGPDKYAKGINDGRPGYTEPSFDQAVEMGRTMKAEDLFGYIYKGRSFRQTQDLRSADFAAVRGLAQGITGS